MAKQAPTGSWFCRVVLGEQAGAEGERVVVQRLQKICPDMVANPAEARG